MGSRLLHTSPGDVAVLSSAVMDSELISSVAEDLSKTDSVLRRQWNNANPASGQLM